MSSLKSFKLQAHIEDHCVPIVVRLTDWSGGRYPVHGFYKVVEPMRVFKKVYAPDGNRYHVDAIANLIIPVGATIYASWHAYRPSVDADDRKMRASEAFVHSIAKQRMGTQIQQADSGWDSFFKYRVGETVKPTQRFSKSPSQCSPGIHFFVNLSDAKHWR
jgi:hypothetical protein